MSFEESFVGVAAAGLAFGVGVVALGLEGGAVFDGGEEHGAGLADRLVAAVELEGAGAVAVAEQALGGLGAKGSVIYSTKPVREYRDAVGIDERISYLAWLFQQNRGVFKSPWTKQETWTLSVWHTEDDAARYVSNFEEFAAAVTA